MLGLNHTIKAAGLAILALWGLGASSLEGSAQHNNERSPYSRFGYGTMLRPTTAANRGMGGLSYGLRTPEVANPANPASYTAVDSMTFIFDLGLSAGVSMLSESGASDRRTLGNLEYATMLFPLTKRMAMSAGLLPWARTGYTFGSLDTPGGDTNDIRYQRRYNGKGSYHQVYIGLAGEPIKGLHLGANAQYLFGNRELERRYTVVSSTANYSTLSDQLSLKGIRFDLGVQYELRLDSTGGRTITLGATFSPKTSLLSERILLNQNVSTSGATAGSIDIVRNDTIRDQSYTLPQSFGAGITYRIANKLLIGADLQYSKWTGAEYQDLEASFQDQWRITLGGEYIPNWRTRSLWKRAKYRFGLSAGNSYLQVPSPSGSLTGYNEYGASIGVGIPLVDRRSSLNIALEYKHLQPKASGMVREQYIGATIGIVFNEGWFRKARVQ